MNINELANELQQPAKVIFAKAKGYGYSGGADGELAPDIIEAIRTGGGPKQIGSAPATSETTEPQPEPTKGQGLGDIYNAFYASTDNLQRTQFEMEKEAAIAQGRMWGHQLYINLQAAKNETLQTLVSTDLERSLTNHQEKAGDYREFVEEKRQKALSAWAASDKQGKTLKQAFAEMKALNASFDI